MTITQQRIDAARKPHAHPVALEIVDRTGSTNFDLLERIDSLARPTLLLALSQTAGRGRNGRSWHSEPGATLTFSLAWKFPLAPHQLAGLPLAVGVALAQALGKLGVLVRLKWPNDILKSGGKLAGVLIETPHAPQGSDGTWAVIGIGMNLTLPDSLEEKIGTGAAGAPWLAQLDRNILMAALLDELTHTLTLFGREGLEAFITFWNELHAFAGQEVVIIDRGQVVRHGVATGIDGSGRLLLDCADGCIAISAGDVSLRVFMDSMEDGPAFGSLVMRRRATSDATARQGEAAAKTMDGLEVGKYAAID